MIDLRRSPTERIVTYIPHPDVPETCVIEVATGRLPWICRTEGHTREQTLGAFVAVVTGSTGSVDRAIGSPFGTLFVVKPPTLDILEMGYEWTRHDLRDTVAKQIEVRENHAIRNAADMDRALRPVRASMEVAVMASSLNDADAIDAVQRYMFYEQADYLRLHPPDEK